MLSFLFVTLFAIIGVAAAGVVAVPVLVLAALFWLILLPIKLLVGFVFGGFFRLVFGLLGAVLGVIMIPLLMVVAGVAIVGAVLAGLLALVAPLVPFALLFLLGWAVYRLARPRPV